MTVVSFVDYTPAPRFDNKPWTRARIEGAASSAGPWETIETLTLDPVDNDPKNPQRRDLTTEDATDETWFRIVFVDADGDESPTSPIPYRTGPAWRPTVGDVAALLRARTTALRAKTNAYGEGEQIGTFNDDTRPSGEQVERIITQAVSDIVSRAGEVISDELLESARGLAAIRAAMRVELSYFPEQTESGQSPFDRLRDLWLDEIAQLAAAVSGNSEGPATRTGFVSVPLVTPESLLDPPPQDPVL